MPTPSYKYGQVTGLFPDLKVVSERAEQPMVCCGYCSGHMAALTAKKGLSTSMKQEAHAMRAKSGRPHNAASNAGEVRAGAKAALGVTLISVRKSDIPDRLRKGFAVVINLQYRLLPDYLKVQSTDVGHSATLFGFKEDGDLVGYHDPLWSQGVRGAWAPWSHILPALWADGNHSTTTVKLVSGGGNVAQKAITTTSAKLILIKKDQDIFDLDGVTKVGDSAMERVDVMSPCGRGTVSDGRLWREWYIDLDGSGKDPRRSVLSRIDPANVKNLPAAAGCTPEELKAAEQKGYDLAMSPFPPRPK